MQLLALILTNIVLGVILYLIISLKLERSASEFRTQKLRKEMNDIIKDFNATAERNITILENRITVLRRLLKQSGAHQSIDLHDMDDEEKSSDSFSLPTDQNFDDFSDKSVQNNVSAGDHPETTKVNSKKSLRGLTSKLKSLLDDDKSDKTPSVRNDSHLSALNMTKGTALDIKIDRDYTDFQKNFSVKEDGHHNSEAPEVFLNSYSDQDISDLFNGTEDVYALIMDLHYKGVNAEDLARGSGIPLGEIKLILNLNEGI